MAEDVRWLSRDEQAAWRAYLDMTARLEARFERGLRAEGFTLTSYEILVRLSEADGRRLRMSELAERSRSSPSRLSHAVARLEERGYVRREGYEADRRGQVCVLTDDGFAALAAAAPGHVSDVREALLDGLSADEFDTLGSLCRKVLRHLDSS